MSLPGRPPRGRSTGAGSGSGAEGNGHVVMSAGHGAVLVGVAVIVGLIVLITVNKSNPGNPGSSPSGTPTSLSTSTTVAAGGTTPATTATTAAATTATTKAKNKKTTTTTASATKGARTNDQVVVQVLNGSGVQGAATQRTNDLKAKGYRALPANNAPQQRTGTGVQCRAGYEKEATVLAQTLQGLGVPSTVEPLTDPVPASYDAAANCYVLLGK